MAFFNDFERSLLKTLSDEELDGIAKNVTDDFNKYFDGKRKILDYKEVKSYIKSIIDDGAEGDEENFRKHVHVVYAEEDERSCRKCKGSGVSLWDEPCVFCITTQFRTKEFHPKWEPKLADTTFAPTDIENLKKAMNDIYGAKEEEKSKGCIDYSDTVFKTERDRKIDHINDRVDSIQANVLEYGNNCISKLIGLNDKLNALYIDLDKDIQSIDTRIDGLESMLKDIKKTLNNTEEIPEPKWPVGTDNLFEVDCLEHKYKICNRIGYVKGKGYLYDLVSADPARINIHCIHETSIHPYKQGNDIKQFTVDERPAKPEYDAGETVVDKDNVTWMIDKVIPMDSIDGINYYYCHKLTDRSVTKRFQQHQIYRLGIKMPKEKELKEAHERLKNMTEDSNITLTSKKLNPKFKVGDLVRLTSGTKIFEVVKVKEENYGGKLNYRYRLKSVDHGYFQYCPQSYLTRVEPPIIFSKEVK